MESRVKKSTKDGEEPYVVSPILRDVRPAGPLGGLLLLLAAPLAALTLLLKLFQGLITDPLGFFRRTRRDPAALPLPSELAGLVHEEVEVEPGVRLHLVSFGRRPGKPLMLFLHGFPECWYSWWRQLVAFREGYEVVAVDMRGYNTSSKPRGLSAYSLDRLTADVAAVVRSRGRSSCTLVGHDWGGAVAWAAAGRYPGLVERLVVAAAPHWYLYVRNFSLRQAAKSYYFTWFMLPFLPELFITHRDAQLCADLFASAHPQAPRRRGAATPADVEVYKAAALAPGAATAALNYYRAVMLADVGLMRMHPEVERGLRRQLPMPVLVVWGSHDRALDLSLLRGVDQVAPRSQVHVLDNCSHWVQLDQPAELQRVMEEWLAAHPL